jgi:hypothetical protein
VIIIVIRFFVGTREVLTVLCSTYVYLGTVHEEVFMFIVLETFWLDDITICSDVDGRVLLFDTREEAEEYASENCQHGQVVEIE